MRRYPRVDAAPIDIYVVSNMGYEYPFKLTKPNTGYSTSRIRESAETHLLDSGIGDDSISNEDVLDLAAKIDSDFVIAKDYLNDHDRTTESIHEFLDLHDDHACRATPLIPLQPPHYKHYFEHPNHDAYVLGGMKYWDGEQVVSALREFRAQVGYGPYVHALGAGCSLTIAKAVAADPDLVQSIDCATPEVAASKARIIDHQLDQLQYPSPRGEGTTVATEALALDNVRTMNNVFAMLAHDPPAGQEQLTAYG